MFHIVLIQIILMSWCFYYQFTKAVQARKKLIYVEVHAFDRKVKRRQSKENLNTVILTTTRQKNNYELFDKFAYLTRAQRLQEMSYEGLLVDAFGLVQPQHAEQQQLKRLNAVIDGKNQENLKKKQQKQQEQSMLCIEEEDDEGERKKSSTAS